MDPRKLVLRQTAVVILGEALCVAAMVGFFALLGQFDRTVVFGGIVGGLVAVLNFFFMAIAVNVAADKAVQQNVKGGQATMKSSYMLRLVCMFAVLFAFAKSGYCNVIAMVVPLVFVRPILTVAEFFRRKSGDSNR